MSILEKTIEPDIEGLLAVINRRAAPKRVHHVELLLDGLIKDQVSDRFGLGARITDNEPFAAIKRDIEVHRFLGYDAFWVEVAEDQQAKIAHQVEAADPDMSWKVAIEHTGPVQTWQDFESYDWPTISDVDFSPLEWLEKNLPENMGCFDMTGSVLSTTTFVMGYESFCYKLFDEPELVDAIFQKYGEFYVDYTRALCDFACIRFMFGADDMGFRSSTLVSANILREKVLPWHKRIAAVSHEHGRPYVLHSCGNIEEIMPDLIEDVRIDGKQSFEDVIVPVTEAKRRYGGQIAILGGIDVDFLCRADEQAIRRRVGETLNACMPGGGYCLGTGNSVADYIPLENYLVMLDEGRRFL